MKILILIATLFAMLTLVSCDMRSGTAKDEMEKFNGPGRTPAAPAPTEAPIDPADIVEVDSDQQGDSISVNGHQQHKNVACTKLNRVMISGGQNEVVIKGPCRQIMINGDNNTVAMDTAFDVTFNGDGNSVEYSRYANGKRLIVNDNGNDNTVKKVAFTGPAADNPGSKPAK